MERKIRRRKNPYVFMSIVYLPACVNLMVAGMPEKAKLTASDLNSDCFVDLKDLAVLAGQWLHGPE